MTGVQTCALPISARHPEHRRREGQGSPARPAEVPDRHRKGRQGTVERLTVRSDHARSALRLHCRTPKCGAARQPHGEPRRDGSDHAHPPGGPRGVQVRTRCHPGEEPRPLAFVRDRLHIAQEMQEVYPDVVGEDSSEEKILMITGWSKTEARLVKAIQELKAEIDELKARLEGNN